MDSFAERRREAGSLGAQIFQSADEPNVVEVIVESDSLERAHEFYDSHGLLAAMDKGGVLEASVLLFAESISSSEQ